MYSFSVPPSLSSSGLFRCSPLFRSRLSISGFPDPSNNRKLEERRRLTCRAELSQDAPFVVAIGSCVLNSLIFPVTTDTHSDEEDSGSGITSTDARFAVMGIISFIPYFNWLSWIFAWLDTGRQRYLVYSLVYLAPYLRTNLSLSPEESWLPLSSIIFCIAHIQLEGSIRSGDINVDALRFISPKEKKLAHKQSHEEYDQVRREKKTKLQSAEEESRKKLGEWAVPKKRPENAHHQTDEEDDGSKP